MQRAEVRGDGIDGNESRCSEAWRRRVYSMTRITLWKHACHNMSKLVAPTTIISLIYLGEYACLD